MRFQVVYIQAMCPVQSLLDNTDINWLVAPNEQIHFFKSQIDHSDKGHKVSH